MTRILITCAALMALAFGSVAQAQEIPTEYREVLTTLGKQGDYKANVLKVNIPRNDLNVTVANVKTPTPFGFGGWVAMTKGGGGMDVMMGDLVLLQEEVNPVMSALLDNGSSWFYFFHLLGAHGQLAGCGKVFVEIRFAFIRLFQFFHLHYGAMRVAGACRKKW